MSQQVLYTTDIHYKILKSHDMTFLSFLAITFCIFSIILYKVFYCTRVYAFINDQINFNQQIWQIVFSTLVRGLRTLEIPPERGGGGNLGLN